MLEAQAATVRSLAFAAATLKPRASVDHEGKAKTCVLTLTQDRKKYETERYRAEKKGTQYSKKERAERFKEPRSDRTVVEAASYEATKGADEQAALLQDRKWSTLNGVTLAKAVESKEFAMYIFATSRDLNSEYYSNLVKSPNSMLTDYYSSGENLKKSELDALNPRYELLCSTKVWRETRKIESALQTSIHQL